jgi:hypothetical protein
MMLRDDVKVEADCLPVDSILVPGYRDLGGVMLGGGIGKVLRMLFPEVSYLDRWSPPEGIPYSYPPLASLAYVEELPGGNSKVVTDGRGARAWS